MNVVVDTNVFVSAHIAPLGNPAKIMELFFSQQIQIFYCKNIIVEYIDVLARPALKINPVKMKKFIEILQCTGILIEPSVSTMMLPDESDRVFYDTAKESGAILITGNIKHYPENNFIMTPSQFLEKYNREMYDD